MVPSVLNAYSLNRIKIIAGRDDTNALLARLERRSAAAPPARQQPWMHHYLATVAGGI